MKYWAMTIAGAVLFIVGLLLGVMHVSAAWASILFIIGTVLLVMSVGRVGKPGFTAGIKKGDKDVGSYQI
jgi:hypothetical protein